MQLHIRHCLILKSSEVGPDKGWERVTFQSTLVGVKKWRRQDVAGQGAEQGYDHPMWTASELHLEARTPGIGTLLSITYCMQNGARDGTSVPMSNCSCSAWGKICRDRNKSKLPLTASTAAGAWHPGHLTPWGFEQDTSNAATTTATEIWKQTTL